MRAKEAIGQLLREKNDLQIFAHQAVEAYNKSATGCHKLSLAYDALLKAASDQKSRGCEECKAHAKRSEKAERQAQEQFTKGKR